MSISKSEIDKSETTNFTSTHSYLVLAESETKRPNVQSISKNSTLRDKKSFFKQILCSSKAIQNEADRNAASLANEVTRTTKSKKLKASKNYHTRYYCPKHKRFHHDFIMKKKCSQNREVNSPVGSLTKRTRDQRIKSRQGSTRKKDMKILDILSKNFDSDSDECQRGSSKAKYSQTSPVANEQTTVSISVDLKQVKLEINEKELSEFKISSPSVPSIISNDHVSQRY